MREAAGHGNATAQLYLARQLMVDGEAKEAARWYTRVAQCGDPEILRSYAGHLGEQGDLDGARAALRAAGDRRALGELATLASGPAEIERVAWEAFAVDEGMPL
ncbi:hypothetical protein ACFWJV_30365 [Streptomyces rochei]|uniref:Sel1 repeat family protein n=1 Tax=Streptomyces ardesiacus TaxID=285564 RepID=A0ABW8HJZ2_9ACTN